MFARDEFASPAPAQLDEITDRPLPWVYAARRAPYFTTDDGEPWTPVGHNDAIAWPPLMWLLNRSDAPDAYFRMLQSHGITCLRLMLEYAHGHNLFDRRSLNEEIGVSPGGFAVFGCGDRHQVALWVVRREPLARDGTVCRLEAPDRVMLLVPGLLAGTYRNTTFNTEAGIVEARFEAANAEGPLRFEVPVVRDLAVAIRPAVQADGIPRVNR